MALKSLLFVFILIAAMAAPIAEAQRGIIGGLLGLIRILGTVFCTANGNMGVNGTATPAFPNALVQLQCNRYVVSTATTNASGIFSIELDPLQYLLSSLLTNCSLVVDTPAGQLQRQAALCWWWSHIIFTVHWKHYSRPPEHFKLHSFGIPVHSLNFDEAREEYKATASTLYRTNKIPSMTNNQTL